MSKDDVDTSAPSGPSSDGEINGDALPPSDNAVVPAHPAPAVMPAHPALPVAPEGIPRKRGRSRWKALALLGILIIGAGGGFIYWQHLRQGGLPLGIVSGNGRIEADEIDIDTNSAGRIIEMEADEGDMLTPQQASPAWTRETLRPR